jgi:23S rRNA (adenine2503-C2)-methyltransferase
VTVTSIYEYSKDELASLLKGEPRYRLDQLWHGLWAEGLEVGSITTIPTSLRARLREQFPSSLEVANDVASDQGATRKWVFQLTDGSTIETVLMRYEDRVTVCVSSQAGCAMGCTFCATGQAGFSGQLSVGQVLEQVMFASRAAAPLRLSNVVFMGMGEPLANYRVTVEVLRRLHDYRGLSARHLPCQPSAWRRRSNASPTKVCPSRWRYHCTPRTTRHATNWCRSIVATRWNVFTKRASTGSTGQGVALVSSGRSSTA